MGSWGWMDYSNVSSSNNSSLFTNTPLHNSTIHRNGECGQTHCLCLWAHLTLLLQSFLHSLFHGHSRPATASPSRRAHSTDSRRVETGKPKGMLTLAPLLPCRGN